MKKLIFSIILLACCFISGPSFAERSGTRITIDPARSPVVDMSDADRGRAVMNAYVRCVIRLSRSNVLKYLKTVPNSKEAKKIADLLSVDECLVDEQLTFNERLFRWSSYDVLYNDYHRDFDLRRVALIPETDFSKMLLGNDPEQSETVFLSQLGECTVRAAPEAANAFITTSIGSKAEKEAMAAVVPFVGSCISQGKNLEFSKSVLRGVVAEALYKFAQNDTVSAMEEGRE